MGILPEDNSRKTVRIEELADITYADYVFDDSDAEEFVVLSVSHSEDEEHPPVNPAHKQAYERRFNRRLAKCNAKKAARQAAKNAMTLPIDGLNVKRNMGAAKWRRVEAARLLAQFADPSDIRYDCSDLIEDTMSAFARLMQSEEGMKLWNEFVEKDEEEQRRFLKELEGELDDMSGDESDATVRADSDDEKRSHHPGYSAKTCFMKMDKKFRSALSKRSGVRLEVVEELEKILRKFFATNPTGTWSDSIRSNQRRFYLHAIAQFLMLQSRTGQNTPQGTLTEVYNSRKKFEPPREPLHSYLSKKFSRNDRGNLIS